jgi:hypothetical protein
MAATTFTDDLATAICERIALGESVRKICKGDDMPCPATIYNWLEEHEAFLEQYTRARARQAELMLDEILEIADDDSEDVDRVHGAMPVVVSRAKLQIDARKWAMSKLAPKKYGDKVDVTSGGDKLPGIPVIQIIAPS